MSEEEKKESLGESILKALGITILIVALIVGAVFLFRSCFGNNTSQSSGSFGSNNNRITYRDARNSDISGDWNESLIEQNFTFIPKYDIVDLQFTFSINNKEGKVIKKVVKNIGNVNKGQQYSVKLTLSDMGLDNIFSAYSTSLAVTGGRVTLI